MNMASIDVIGANIRLTNEENRSVCLINNVSPNVSANTAAAFVSAIEKIYNNGPCTARMNVAYDITS